LPWHGQHLGPPEQLGQHAINTEYLCHGQQVQPAIEGGAKLARQYRLRK
jgi:hypothetical protein